MKALVTGASSGIGRDIAKELAKRNIDLILVSRDLDKLNDVKEQIQNVQVRVIAKDLSDEKNCIDLYNEVKDENIDILINNAGFGVFGEFTETSLEKELNMIKTNLVAMHILTKLFLQDMKKQDKGYILNVASIAGYMPGPLMAAYYSSKAYVVRLTQAIKEELKRANSKVKLGVLCPGPVDTNFNNVADVKFKAKSLSSEYVAKYTVDRVLKNKFYIIPGWQIRAVRIFSKIIPDSLMAKMAYKVQIGKKKQ
ncbi:MAG: SDR family oxidoreductase [Clostridia bacterium]|nr:SDR family oxidoreductase [Clostridia bacterium]